MAGLESTTFSVLGDLPYQRIRRLISIGLGVGIQALVLFIFAVVGILIPSKIETFNRRAPIYVELVPPAVAKNVLIPKKLKLRKMKLPKLQEKRIQKLMIPIDRSIPRIDPLETNIYTSRSVRQPPPVSLVKNKQNPKPTPVMTGVFGNQRKVISNPKPTPVMTGVFGNPNGIIGDAKGSSLGNVTKLGVFDLADGGVHGNSTRNVGHIARGIVSNGFDNEVLHRENNSLKFIVQSGEFDKKPSVKLPGQRLPKIVMGHPVEIISKPDPIYTKEAIQLGLEGEVILEVIFMASGKIKILKVLKGLGYGLDESARSAAEKIKFKPGQRQGKPVNVQGRLRVIFQLAGVVSEY